MAEPRQINDYEQTISVIRVVLAAALLAAALML